MANPKKPKQALALSKFLPKSIVVSVNGEDIIVPSDAHENAMANIFLASRMRNFLQKHLDMYKDDELKLGPRELKDLASAARDIAAFSAEVYLNNEPIETGGEKKAQEIEADDIPFNDLSKLPEVKHDSATGIPPKTDS